MATDDTAGRSRIELVLRRYPDRAWLVEDFMRVFRGSDQSTDAIAFLQCVEELATLKEVAAETASPAKWAKRIDEILTAVNWPGVGSLSSSEFQLVNRWRKLLNDFARLEAVAPRIGLPEAVRRLAALAAETIYQPESGPGLVQVLGTLEAAGMEFDSIWVSGLDASQWPPVSHPVPFISRTLQRQHEMPDATPGDTLAFSKRVLHRLVNAADQCVLSWATLRDDSKLMASSLLEEIEHSVSSTVVDPGWFGASLAATKELVVHSDDEPPAVAADERVRGGAYTVQRQYSEPFSAFVYGRLGVRLPEPITTGLSPGVRGNIIHNALHNLLAMKPAQTDIGGWTGEDRGQRIGSAIDAALAEHTIHANPVTQRIIGLERNRLRQLLLDFIAAETEREPFSVVNVEHQVGYDAFGIRLGLRIDRIDSLADGRLLIIDYKTGQTKHFLNGAGDLTDLQLIVYADALNEDIGGVVLINIDRRNINYRGAGAGGPWNKQKEEDWPDMLAAWRSVVHQSLRDIAAGDVRINVLHTVGESRPLNVLSRKEEQKRGD